MKNITLSAATGIVALAIIGALGITLLTAPLAHAQVYTTTSTNTSTTLTSDQGTSLESQITTLLAQVQSLQTQLTAIRNGTTPVGATACYFFSSNLTPTDRGVDVTALQSFLMVKGYLNIPATTGYFGPMTKLALEQFQTANNVGSSSYGFVDANTRALLNVGCGFGGGTTSNSAPTVSYLSPAGNPVGTLVTIYGSGFGNTTNTIHFGLGALIPNLNTSSDTSLQFTVPSYTTPCVNLAPNTVCTMMSMLITPGVYPVSVTNSRGTSNSMNFMVTTALTPNNGNTSNAPTLSYVSPTTAKAGDTVTIYGTGFPPNAMTTIMLSGNGMTTSPTAVSSVDGTRLVFSLPAMSPAGVNCMTTSTSTGCVASGTYTLTFAGSGGTSNALSFTVQ